MTPLRKDAVLALSGGSLYLLLEVAWRGHSHWTMFLLGGLCFALIGLLNEVLPRDIPLLFQGLLGSAVIVLPLEFLTGCVVNLGLGWEVWDYSGLPLNLLGQICLPFGLLWVPVAMAAAVLDDWLRWKWFHQPPPRYTFLRRKGVR